MIWNNSFEAYPSGSDFASVTAKAIRESKVGFHEYIEVEHTFDGTDNPIMTHKTGFCSIIKEVESLETPLVEGAFQVDGDNRAFRVRETSSPITFGSFDHEYLYGGDQPDSHTQYLRKDEDRTISELDVGELRGLKGTPPGTPGDRAVDKIMSQGEHGIPATGGSVANHKENSIDFVPFLEGANIPLRCVKKGSNSAFVDADGDYYVNVANDHMFTPVHDDPNAYYTINPNNTDSGKIKCKVLNYSNSFSLEGRYIVP